MVRVEGGITAPEGFLASGVACGIKRRGKDLALMVSQRRASAAGTLTTNALRASSVLWSAQVLRRGFARALVVNSGNANCCTGAQGQRDTSTLARWVAQRLGIRPQEVLVASTGIIGRPLAMKPIREGIDRAVSGLSRHGSHRAAEAILTTDTRPKELAVRFGLGRSAITLGGVAKGSGMVSPRMATLLVFLTTDAAIDPPLLRNLLREAVSESFNAITVDGETSTNDMVLLLANGAQGAPPIRQGTAAQRSFSRALAKVCQFLAQEIVRDGEGVTRTMRVAVTGAISPQAASCVARQVAESLLVKTMVAGRDPNWGRIASAIGASAVRVHPSQLTIRLGEVVVFRNGEPRKVNHDRLLSAVDQPQVAIGIHLGSGPGNAQMVSGDLTEGYVRINAKYTT